jgi:hypothetical protein
MTRTVSALTAHRRLPTSFRAARELRKDLDLELSLDTTGTTAEDFTLGSTKLLLTVYDGDGARKREDFLPTPLATDESLILSLRPSMTASSG